MSILALLITFLAVNGQLVKGTASPHFDALNYFGPYFTLIADHARAGKFVLWDPWTSGGTPAFAEPELGTFSPVTVLIGGVFGGNEASFRLYWLLIWFLGPFGILVLARHLRVPLWGAFIVALGFAFSGFYTGNAQHISSLYSISFLPLILWRLDVALQGRRIRPAFEAGSLWGLSSLAGYPQLTILSAGFVFLWALGRWGCARLGEQDATTTMPAQTPVSRPALGFTFVVLTVVAVTGIAIFLPSYYAFFTEGRGYSDRVGVRSRVEAVESQALHPGALATFASPYLPILQIYNSRLWEYTDVSMSSVYLGACTTILGFLALASRPRSVWRWWLAVVALFFLGCALGRALPLRGWLYDLLPPMRYFRNPALFRVYAMFSIALLALLATKDLHEAISNVSTDIWKRLAIVATILALSSAICFIVVARSVEHLGNHFREGVLHLIGVWFGVVAISYFVFLKGNRRKLLPLLFASVAIPDAALSCRLAAATIFDRGAEQQAWRRIDAEHDTTLDLSPHGLERQPRPPGWIGPQFNSMNIPLRMPTFENYAALINRFQIDFIWRRMTLEAMSTGDQRIWFSTNVVMAAPTDSAYEAFLKRSEQLGAPILLIHSREEMLRLFRSGATAPSDGKSIDDISTLPAAKRVSTKVIRYRPNELILEISCPDDGWVLVTDRWASSWHVSLDNKPAELLAGNFIFRAVRVHAGNNELRFSYQPEGWPALLIVSWGTLLLVSIHPEKILARVGRTWLRLSINSKAIRIQAIR